MTGPSATLTRRVALRAGCVGLAGLAATAGCTSRAPPPAERAAEETDGLSAFADLADALSAGYRSRSTYVVGDDGVLGVPFVNNEVESVRADRPRVLFYDLDDSGQYSLLGAEWVVPAEDADERPSLFGRAFHDPEPGRFPGQSRHYGLHAWLASENPAGPFETHHVGVEPPPYHEALSSVRGTLRQFLSFRGGAERAREVGYVNTETWVETERGAVGVPFVHPDHRGRDLDAPAVLLYRMTSSWYYELLGAEWFVDVDDREESPSLLGQDFHGPLAGHADSQPRHYGLHAWLFRANPAGIFAPYNPAIATQPRTTG